MKIKLITTVLLLASILAAVSCSADAATKTLTREQLQDKIKGGWAARPSAAPTAARPNSAITAA